MLQNLMAIRLAKRDRGEDERKKTAELGLLTRLQDGSLCKYCTEKIGARAAQLEGGMFR
jgi:hypothetical protein